MRHGCGSSSRCPARDEIASTIWCPLHIVRAPRLRLHEAASGQRRHTVRSGQMQFACRPARRRPCRMTHDAQPNPTAYERLRGELLTSGLSDWVSLAEVQQIISHFELTDTDRERQDLILRTIRSLLDDALMQIGELPGPDEKFP